MSPINVGLRLVGRESEGVAGCLRVVLLYIYIQHNVSNLEQLHTKSNIIYSIANHDANGKNYPAIKIWEYPTLI